MRSNSRYVPLDPAVIEEARRMDLLTYLKYYEPSNLVRIAPNVYSTKEHDSLKISNGKWFWWSRGIGGISALDYLIKVKDFRFVEAIEILTGNIRALPTPTTYPTKEVPKQLKLPPKNGDCHRTVQYLLGRGIDEDIIRSCLTDGTIYESANYHNVVFVGKDEHGKPKYAACRGTLGSDFKQDVAGSDKRYSFRLVARQFDEHLHLFESAIDLLSYASLLKNDGMDYNTKNLLSLSGVYQPKNNITQSKIPIALETFLTENPHIKTIILHLDNDNAGRLATATITKLLEKDYKIVDEPPKEGKDYNDFLLSYLGLEPKKQSHERSDAR